MSLEKWCNEICCRGNRRNLEKSLSRSHFVYHENDMVLLRRELGTPAVGSERLTTCVRCNQQKILLGFYRASYSQQGQGSRKNTMGQGYYPQSHAENHSIAHGCARVAHYVTARCRNFSHYCRPLRQYDN